MLERQVSLVGMHRGAHRLTTHRVNQALHTQPAGEVARYRCEIKTGERNGPVTSVKSVVPDDHLVVMSEDGQIMRIRAADVSEVGRNTMGVTVMDIDDEDAVASVDVLPASDDEDEATDADEDEATDADEE